MCLKVRERLTGLEKPSPARRHSETQLCGFGGLILSNCPLEISGNCEEANLAETVYFPSSCQLMRTSHRWFESELLPTHFPTRGLSRLSNGRSNCDEIGAD